MSKSLSEANTYYRRFAKINGPEFPVILIANKMDRRDQVLREETLLRWMNSRPNLLKRLVHGSAATGVFDCEVIPLIVMMVNEFRRTFKKMNSIASLIEDVEEDNEEDEEDDAKFLEYDKSSRNLLKQGNVN